MELLSEKEINSIIQRFGLKRVLKWEFVEFEDKMMGQRGDHLKLLIEAENEGVKSKLKLFVKCMPRFDKLKAEYLRDINFFCKEYIMLSKLFVAFQNGEGLEKWHPKLFYVREDLFVFEDVSELGYKMPYFKDTMPYETIKATIKTLARFHGQSYIYEEKKSKKLGRPYRIWEEYSEYLQEPAKTRAWRDAGRNAMIDYLKVFSKHKSNPDFLKKLEKTLPKLFEKALELMKPSTKYRNAVVHRDLWTNNIFIREGNSEPHVLIVDFQTILYCSPMLDLSSLIYFNTSKADRETYSSELIDIYYRNLSTVLNEAGINIATIFPKEGLMKAYNDSLIFGMTQASLIVPIIAMSNKKKEEIYGNPIRSKKASVESRSEEIIEIAKEDPVYHKRVSELFNEIVEMYIYSNVNNNISNGF